MNMRPRVVGTPPFVPSTATQPEIDPMQLVRELLAPPPAPVEQPMGILDRIGAGLGALAQGISVGVSNDPGRALQNQLQQQQQMRFQAQQAQRDRDEKLSLLNRQFGLGILQSQIGEQQDIRKEKRVQGYKAEERKAIEEAEIRQFAREKTGKEELLNLNHHKALELARFNNLWEADKQQKSQEFTEAMTKLKENNDLLAKQVDMTLSFWTKGMSVGQAKDISEKILNRQPLTPKEEKEMSRVIQMQEARARRAASGGGSGGGGLNFASAQKDAWKMAQEFAKNPPYILSNGSVVDATGLQTDIRGNKVPIGVEQVLDAQGKPVLDANGQPKTKPLTIQRQMSPSEAAQYSMQTVFPAALAAIAPGRVAKADATTVKEPADAAAARYWDGKIAEMRKQGMDDAAIASKLNGFLSQPEATPQDQEFVMGALIRNKVGEKQPTKQGSVDKVLGTGEGRIQKKIESKPGAFGRRF